MSIWESRDSCIKPTGKTSECGQVSSQLVEAQANLARVARLANKSRRHYAKYADELRASKAQVARSIERRDLHMSECPGAAARFAS